MNGPMTARSAGPPEVSGHTLKPDQAGRLCAFLQPWSAAWAQAWSRLSIGAPQGEFCQTNTAKQKRGT